MFAKPEMITADTIQGEARLAYLLSTLPRERVVDSVREQLAELYHIRHPELIGTTADKSETDLFASSVAGGETDRFGTWVYYPWNGYLVHFLPEPLHTELRTSRNRNLITGHEQTLYRNARVGIAGLSVGNSIMGALLYTGGPARMKLADHDELSASNTNRIRAGFTKLGHKKTHVAAMEIYETDPYAELSLYDNGLNPENLEEFLGSPKLDLLVEEMDSIYLKIRIRLIARKLQIPVVMAADNGDGVVLDVERFDLDPSYPLFHGDVPEKELVAVTEKTPKQEAARMITRWVHPENVAVRMKESLLSLGKTLYTWPQLGTAAFTAGTMVAYTVRQILSGADIRSGKYLYSPDELLLADYHTEKQVNRRRELDTQFKKALKLGR
jgi:molybdopterin/thiamine biosynthesis adenylyltransferase